jgi:hypothetical protein
MVQGVFVIGVYAQNRYSVCIVWRVHKYKTKCN